MQSIVVPLHSRYSSSFNGIPYHSWSFDVILVIPRRLTLFLIIHRHCSSFNVFPYMYSIALHIIYGIKHLLSTLHIIKRHSISFTVTTRSFLYASYPSLNLPFAPGFSLLSPCTCLRPSNVLITQKNNTVFVGQSIIFAHDQRKSSRYSLSILIDL